MTLNSKYGFNEFKKLFDENYQQYIIQATRIVRSPELAQDIVQDCFLKFWEIQSDITINESAQGYLSRMVRNKCLDYLRSSAHLRIVEGTSDLENVEVRSFDSLEYDELKSSVNDIIDSLPERCRQVFILSRFEEMSYKEIAIELEISSKTVENQISKALKSMRQGLSKFLSILF